MEKPKSTDHPQAIYVLVEGGGDRTVRPWRGPRGRIPPEVYQNVPLSPDHLQGIYLEFDDRDGSTQPSSTEPSA